MPVVVLRTSRFFPEEDDSAAVRKAYFEPNVGAELLYRRGDIADIVSAHLAALGKAADIGFETFIVHHDAVHARRPSRSQPRRARGDRPALPRSRGAVRRRAAGRCSRRSAGSTTIAGRARRSLAAAADDFRKVLDCLGDGRDSQSLALAVGAQRRSRRGLRRRTVPGLTSALLPGACARLGRSDRVARM